MFNHINYLLILTVLLSVLAIIVTIFLAKAVLLRHKILAILSSLSIISIILSGSLLFYFYNNMLYGADKIKFFSFSKRESREAYNGEIELLSLHLAYPDRISEPIRTNGTLGFCLDNTNWFYWADGRILEEDNLTKKDDFVSYSFYTYGSMIPDVLNASDENYKKIQEQINSKRISVKDNTFADMLYSGNDQATMYTNMKLISVLGYRIQVHSMIVERIKNVDYEVKAIAKTNADVSKFLDSLAMTSGYAWRNVSKTSSRSYHSYGVAVDVLPRKTYGKQVYWGWSRVNDKHWYAIPLKKRWLPPKEVIAVFENYGFIWGGKWQFFDTIHFEYRPEIIIYNRLMNDKKLLAKLIRLI